MVKTKLTEQLGIQFPVIMAPMFLVSNEAMIKAAIKGGIVGTFPSLNYRDEKKLAEAIQNLHAFKKENPQGNFGVNLIVQQANPWYKNHLKVCIDNQVPFFITSLGNPEETIKLAHSYGGKVYCDVTNIEHAKKCADAGADGFIAVGQGAGGHAGPYTLQILIPTLINHFPNIPVVGAGGVASGAGVLSLLALGAQGASVGTRFIASTEAGVSKEYKDALISYGMEDVVLSDKISGTPCNIINTPFAQKIGTSQNWFEKWLSKNKKTKKYFKMLIQKKGFDWLEKSVLPGNYNNLWCAGQTIELIETVISCDDIIAEFKKEFTDANNKLNAMM